MATYLVVGNQTLGSLELRAALTELAGQPDVRIHLVVPQTPLDHYQVPVGGQVQTIAEHQLSVALEDLADVGIPITGEVGVELPLEAVRSAVEQHSPVAVIVSTFPPGASRWLGAGLPAKIERKLGLSVTHVVGRTYDQAKLEKRRYAEVRRQLGMA